MALDDNDKIHVTRYDETTGGGTQGSAILAEINGFTGWSNHNDNTYTEGSPFQPAADEWTAFDSADYTSLETQLPTDVTELFDKVNSLILGRNGDGINITIELTAKPTTANATYLDTAIDIGGGVGRIYPRTLTFPKGQNVARTVSYSFNAYTLDTWEANGGAIVFNPTAAIDIYGLRVILTRQHKARD